MAAPAQPPRGLHVVGGTGEVTNDRYARLDNAALLAKLREADVLLAGLSADREALQDKVTTLLVQVKALKRVNEDRRATHSRRAEIEEAHAYWQQTTGKTRSKLSAERHDAMAARLNEGYTVEHFKLASDGAAHNNPWPHEGRKPMVEIETFCRKGKWLEDFALAGYEWRRTLPVAASRPVA